MATMIVTDTDSKSFFSILGEQLKKHLTEKGEKNTDKWSRLLFTIFCIQCRENSHGIKQAEVWFGEVMESGFLNQIVPDSVA